MKSINAIGVMSGTSLDGLDIAFCKFIFTNNNWSYHVIEAKTFAFPKSILNSLQNAKTGSGLNLVTADRDLGIFIGKKIKQLLKTHRQKPVFIASHGQTIFHNPKERYTTQIGSAAHIYAQCCIPVISNFRELDVALGGQGAPLVPIGDMLLFKNYAACINIGGFANISFSKNKKRMAYDICPANLPLNNLASKLGRKFDKNGNLAKQGIVDNVLLKQLNHLNYYRQNGSKSLGEEWLLKYFYPILNKNQNTTQNKLATINEHISTQIAESINKLHLKKSDTVLLTGGGTFNNDLVNRIKLKTSKVNLVIPDVNTIAFKEAIIFAFLGVLKVNSNINCLKSYTGAKKDSTTGDITGKIKSPF